MWIKLFEKNSQFNDTSIIALTKKIEKNHDIRVFYSQNDQLSFFFNDELTRIWWLYEK